MDKQKRIGRTIKSSVVGGEYYQAYIPSFLPPFPPLRMEQLSSLLDKANTALGRLDGMSQLLPDTSLFLYMYIRKEAVLSSQIEGTQSSLSDLLLFENENALGVPLDDVQEVSCYVSALNYGLDRLKDLPLSLRLIREIHEKLMTNARGSHKQPGYFRTSQNWIGGTRPSNALFVPPPPEYLTECLDNFEKFLHDDTVYMPVLIKAALAHVQFETIHPFLDGNGRLGRLLITLILCHDGVLSQPLLYLSLYLKTHRQTYYELLQSVRITGDWEAWVEFFLKGIIETSAQATQTAKDIIHLFEQDKNKMKTIKSSQIVYVIYDYMQRHVTATTTKLVESCQSTLPRILRGLKILEKLGIIKETTGKDRHKVFVYTDYLEILNQGTNTPYPS